MILWLDGAHDAHENMRRDALLLEAAEAGGPAVLRLFGFAPPGLTLGRNQDPTVELDLDRCLADGVAVATRPTGGGAIFHDEEWTYSLAAPLDDPLWGGPARRTCERIAGLLAGSLRTLGLPARLAPAGHPGRGEPLRGGPGPAPPCFASTARQEVVLGDRKLVGSAQRRTRAAFLQQGSLLLGDGHLRIAGYLRLSEPERAAARRRLAASATHAGAWLGSNAPLERWAEALAARLGPGVTRAHGDREAPIPLALCRAHSYTSPLRGAGVQPATRGTR